MLFIVIGLFLYTLLVIFKEEPPVIKTKAKVWPVKVMPVKLQSYTPVLTLYGVVENPGVLNITAPGSSYITKLPVREGQIVAPGELLVELDQRDFLPKVQSASAAVTRVQAQLENIKLRHTMDVSTLETDNKMLALKRLELNRTELLKKRELGSQVAVDQAQNALQTQKLAVAQRQFSMQEYPHKISDLKAQLEQAKADLSLARLALERSRVVARSRLIIGRINAAVGDSVQQNQSLFPVYPYETMQVRAKIPAPYVDIVQAATMMGDKNTDPLLGNVEGIDIELVLSRLSGEADTRGLDALLVARTRPDRLRKGMALTIYLDLPEHAESMAIPYEALYGVDRSYKVVDGKLQGIQLTRLGDVLMEDGVMWALVRSKSLTNGDVLVATHLPNAVNGLAVDSQTRQK